MSKRRFFGVVVLGWAGDSEKGMAAAKWYESGADPEKYPECMSEEWNKTPNFTRLIVVTRDRCVTYECLPIPLEIQPPCAFGSGADFAIGAMAMGASARRAVEVANDHSWSCGFGVEAYIFQEGQTPELKEGT
jgi:hypothetical protein